MKESKKFDLLKVLGITFVVVVLLSWVIPAGYFYNGSFVSTDTTNPIGLYDLFRVPVISFAAFIQFALLFLAIGCFYGVLGKTGAYTNIVNKISDKWSSNKKGFLILTTVLFALLTSLTGLTSVVFILVPFFVAILFKLGYKKMPTLAATVGAMLIGQIATIFGANTWGYLVYAFSNVAEMSMMTMIFARVILLAMLVVLLIVLITKGSKETSKNKKETQEEIPLYEENPAKKSSIPLIIISILLFVLLVLGAYNWAYGTKWEVFNNLHEAITSFKINGYPIFSNLLGGIPALGKWGNNDIVVILILASLLIGWLYSVKMKDILTAMKDGAKKMLPVSFYAVLSCVVFAFILNMGDEGNFVDTIVNKMLGSQENFSFLGASFSNVVAGFFYNDFASLVGNFFNAFALYDKATIPVIAILMQTLYGLVMLIGPTSIFLFAGLTLLDIKYKEWVKYIWKYVLIVLGIILVVSFILTM